MPTALITGASSGIGAAFAQELAKRQYDLVLVARSVTKLEEISQQLQNQHKVAVEVITQDLAAPNAAKEVFDAVSHKHLIIDLLINNAGFGDYGLFSESSRIRQLEMIQLNVLALVDLTHQFLPLMKKRGFGSIINVSSLAAFRPLPCLSVYAATKAFVLSFSESLWAENQEDGIRVLALCPGRTDTEFFKVAQMPQQFPPKSTLNSSADVVRKALKALEGNRSNLVTGWKNKIKANLSRFLSREAWVKLNTPKKNISRYK
ncbi:MAG: SDR family oxidoreductase [Cyanobacteria bacterium P01_D01_bin.44]